MENTLTVDVKVQTTFIDREQEEFTVIADTWNGEDTLRFQAKAPDGTLKDIEFFKDDAPFIEWLIREAAK